MTRVPAAVTTSLAALALAAGLSLAGTARAQSPVVNCFDEERGIVTPTMSQDCKGRPVSDEEAARIKDARTDRIRAGIAARENKLFPGRRAYKVGSAFFIASDGSLLSNEHVASNCPLMSVETPDGKRARGRLVASSEELDLALIASDSVPTAVARFSSAAIKPGLRADLIGYPTQGIAPEKPIFTAGTVPPHQARLRHPDRFLIQADVRSGNSGGPVLDAAGDVLGVVFAQLNRVKILERTGRQLPDLALAVRNRAVWAFMQENGATPHLAETAATLDREQALSQARNFVARIACWR